MELIVFDLDGTLVDSRRDIANSLNAALATAGRTQLDEAAVSKLVGRGASALVRSALGDELSEGEFERTYNFFLAQYQIHLLDETLPYPGVPEALGSLRQSGFQLALLSNKPQHMSHRILEGLQIESHFIRIYGGDSFPHTKPHPIGLHSLCSELSLKPAQALMVGDSGIDIQTGRNAGIRSVGCLWGFQPDAMQEQRPDFVVSHMRDLVDVANRLRQLP